MYNKFLQFEKLIIMKMQVSQNAQWIWVEPVYKAEKSKILVPRFAFKTRARREDKSKCKFSFFVSPLTFSKIMNMYIPGPRSDVNRVKPL